MELEHCRRIALAAPLVLIAGSTSALAASQQAKLTKPVAFSEDMFGLSVAIDGDTAVVGSRFDNSMARQPGAAQVFRRSGSAWAHEAELKASDGEWADGFGYSVAISGDSVIVGAFEDEVAPNDSRGSAYVFARAGGIWGQQAKLLVDDITRGATFGVSVAVSGSTAVVGALFDDVAGDSRRGSAHVFTRNGQTWNRQAKLVSADGQPDDLFGQSVAISDDTILVGAAQDDEVTVNQGSAYIFVRSGSTWSEQAKLLPTDGPAGGLFGYRVALEGDTAAVGRLFDFAAGPDQGSAYVFARNSDSWSQAAKLTPPAGKPSDWFGYSVAISSGRVLVGALAADNLPGLDQGAIYVFRRGRRLWIPAGRLAATDGAPHDSFGYAVALSGDTALVGAPHQHVGSTSFQGSAYVFTSLGDPIPPL